MQNDFNDVIQWIFAQLNAVLDFISRYYILRIALFVPIAGGLIVAVYYMLQVFDVGKSSLFKLGKYKPFTVNSMSFGSVQSISLRGVSHTLVSQNRKKKRDEELEAKRKAEQAEREAKRKAEQAEREAKRNAERLERERLKQEEAYKFHLRETVRWKNVGGKWKPVISKSWSRRNTSYTEDELFDMLKNSINNSSYSVSDNRTSLDIDVDD